MGRDGVDYSRALLSLDGNDKPGPTTLFKRENPDEICAVGKADVVCPTIVVGTWRDMADFTSDYDDGQPEVAPVRLVPDLSPPAPTFVKVRDSESLRVTFDEAIAAGAAVTVKAVDAAGAELPIVEPMIRFPGPHELLVRTAVMTDGAAYTLVVHGLADALGNVATQPLHIGWTAPSSNVPFTPFEDGNPPQLLAALPESPTTLRVKFSEPVGPEAGSTSRYAILGGSAPQVLSAAITGGGRDVLLTTTPQPLMGALTLAVTKIPDLATPPNVLASAQVDFLGFGDQDAPILVRAEAIGPQQIVLTFDEALDTATARAAASYSVTGVTLTGVEFAGDPALLSSAFDPQDAPYVRNIVVLTTSTMTGGATYSVTADVRDLSGNEGGGMTSVVGRASKKKVDVVLEYRISDSETVAGAVPPRALSPSRLATEREGVFLVGASGFPPEGSPLGGVEPQMRDDGTGGDATAGDGVYTLVIGNVPLGDTLEWKAFAAYTVAWKNGHPSDSAAAFADALPGPSVFSDGQEFPGNENGARILGDADGDGRVVLRNLFGDETTYKKLTMTPAFQWVVDDVAYAP